MHHPTDRITHTTAFVTPVVEHWLEREIAQWVHPMKDRSNDPSHHEQTLYLWATSRSAWSDVPCLELQYIQCLELQYVLDTTKTARKRWGKWYSQYPPDEQSVWDQFPSVSLESVSCIPSNNFKTWGNRNLLHLVLTMVTNCLVTQVYLLNWWVT